MRFPAFNKLISATLLSIGLSPFALSNPEAFLSCPDIHGDKVVFTAEGDLWLAELSSGEAWRITSDPGLESFAHFSPDGAQIAFTANYDGGNDVYVMPTAGGTPRRLTYDAGNPDLPNTLVLGWTPDGRDVLYNSNAKIYGPTWQQEMTKQLFAAPASGGLSRQLAVPTAAFASLSRDGHSLAYVPSTNSWMNWFRYEGGEADQIWLADLASGSFKQLTQTKDVETQPVWVGSTIYFVSERSGVRNLWKLDPGTKKAAQVTFFKDLPVRFPATDGKRIVFQLGPGLGLFDPSTGKTVTLSIHLHSDRIHSRPFQSPVWPSDAQMPRPTSSLAPDAKRVAISSRGRLFTVSDGAGAMHTLVSDSAQRVQNPAWSPDGKQIAYISDASGEEQLYLVPDEQGVAPRQLTHTLVGEHGAPVWSPNSKYLLIGDRQQHVQLVDPGTGEVKTIAIDKGPWSGYYIENDFCFSPDSKWIAYSLSLGPRLASVFLYEIASGKSVLVSDPGIDSNSPVFSADGKFLFMLQQRSITQSWALITSRMSLSYAPVVTGFTLAKNTHSPLDLAADSDGGRVDLDGLPGRSFDLGVPAGQYTGLLAGHGRLLIQADTGVQSVDIATGKVTTLMAGVDPVGLDGDGKKLLVSSSKGLQVVDEGRGSVAVPLDGLTFTIEPEKEWKQVFEETWRVWRDLFYDPNMHGVDWKAMRSKYEAELPMVASRHDLMLLRRDMIGELNIGHSFAGAQPDFVTKWVHPGLLGVDLAWDPSAQAFKITHILRGDSWEPENRSPLAAPGLDVREGDYLLKIGGVVLKGDQDPAAFLLGTAGHPTEVTINRRPTLSGAQTLTVKPLASDSNLRYKDWIAGRRAYVEKASGGQIAYMSIADMGGSGAKQFAQQYYPNVDKPATIVDIRGNDGGNISGNLLNELASKPLSFFAYRNGTNYRREGWAPLGRLALVANEWDFSDAENFCDRFKELKLGPVVGHRTAGGLVGPVIYMLEDGSGVGVPNYGGWNNGRWLVEGKGVVPDYEVDQDPAAVLAGRDPQLEKAVELLLAELKAHPFVAPSHPPYPVKLGGSRS